MPRTLVICDGFSRIACSAEEPRVQMIAGRTILISLKSMSFLHVDASSGNGVRFPGGRHFTTLVIKTASLFMPSLVRARVSSWPERPTNGLPCASSSPPGPSPTNIIGALGSPSPKTTCVLPMLPRGHARHFVYCA